MSIGVVLRRSRATAVLGRATGVLAIMIACSALIGTPSSAADPYPPTPPCSLAWSATSTSDNSVLIGSGLGDSQSVSVVLEPQATVLGTYVTDETGAFQASVSIPSATSTDATQWLRAESVKASCGTHAPPRGGPSTPPPTSPAPSTTSPSEQPPGSSGVPGTSPAPSTGTTGLGGGVVTSGSAPADRPGGSGNNGYPVTPGSSSRGSGYRRVRRVRRVQRVRRAEQLDQRPGQHRADVPRADALKPVHHGRREQPDPEQRAAGIGRPHHRHAAAPRRRTGRRVPHPAGRLRSRRRLGTRPETAE